MKKIGDPGPTKRKIGDPGPTKPKKLAIRAPQNEKIGDPGPIKPGPASEIYFDPRLLFFCRHGVDDTTVQAYQNTVVEQETGRASVLGELTNSIQFSRDS